MIFMLVYDKDHNDDEFKGNEPDIPNDVKHLFANIMNKRESSP